MNKICYKVVDKDFDRYYSIMSTYLPLKFVLEYSIGKRTVPNIGKIFVFNNLQNAIDFVGAIRDNRAIMKGLAENIGVLKFLCDYVDLGYYTDSFWEIKNKHLKISNNEHAMHPPIGTLSCSAFTPIEFV